MVAMRGLQHWTGTTAILVAATIFGLTPLSWASPEFLDPSQKVLTESAARPNIVFILTDDQDLHMNSLDYVPRIKKHLIDKGTLYKKHFCTTAICCPARVSILTGKLSHNTNVTDITPPYGTIVPECLLPA